MFLENQDILPLFNMIEGGQPAAFLCKHCKQVFKTEMGILRHLKATHKIIREKTACLFSTEESKEQKTEEKLVIARNSKSHVIPITRIKATKSELAEMSDEELQKHISKEK